MKPRNATEVLELLARDDLAFALGQAEARGDREQADRIRALALLAGERLHYRLHPFADSLGTILASRDCEVFTYVAPIATIMVVIDLRITPPHDGLTVRIDQGHYVRVGWQDPVPYALITGHLPWIVCERDEPLVIRLQVTTPCEHDRSVTVVGYLCG